MHLHRPLPYHTIPYHVPYVPCYRPTGNHQFSISRPTRSAQFSTVIIFKVQYRRHNPYVNTYHTTPASFSSVQVCIQSSSVHLVWTLLGIIFFLRSLPGIPYHYIQSSVPLPTSTSWRACEWSCSTTRPHTTCTCGSKKLRLIHSTPSTTSPAPDHPRIRWHDIATAHGHWYGMVW